MKMITKLFVMMLALIFSVSTQAQKIKLKEGDLSVLKSESSINVEFVYDGMSVGKYDTEKEYMDKKREEYNKKEAGKGDAWAASWIRDREARFEPKFKQLFEETSGLTISPTAKYTLIFKTTSTEPGYNIVVSRKNASLDAEVWIVETADKTKKIAVITVDNAPGGTFGGYDYDTGTRIAESYAISGKKLGKFLKK